MQPEDIHDLIELLEQRAESHGAAGYTFLDPEGEPVEVLSYARLARRSRAIAERLVPAAASGERALMLYPAGLDFVAGFFGCLRAGLVAVPSYPPRLNKPQPRLAAIADDCRPAVVVTTSELLKRRQRLLRHLPQLADIPWVATDDLEADIVGGRGVAAPRRAVDARRLGSGPDALAFLQYTSGSTSTPKGVRVSHGNLLANEAMIQSAFATDSESVVVGWLPLFHDMGLIGNVLQPLWVGARCVLMSPMAFLQNPLRWLQAVSRQGAEECSGIVSGGPDFAYLLCARRVSEDDRQMLDLSRWRVAFSGAEPVRAATLDEFFRAFEPHGLRREAFFPCYGLAEATLFVAGAGAGEGAVVQTFDAEALEQHRARPVTADEARDAAVRHQQLVSSGRAPQGAPWRIVSAGEAPEDNSDETAAATFRPCPEGAVGEIWVWGAHLADGYWGRPEASRQTFAARLADGSGPWLRTGDLGFERHGELFVTGRVKDLVILAGRNLYPQDLETSVEAAHGILVPAAGAAFSVERDGRERLVVVHEVERRFRPKDSEVEAVAAAVRRAVVLDHEVEVYSVALLRYGSIPRTTSGKIQRHQCRQRWIAGSLNLVGEHRLDGDAEVAVTEELPDFLTLAPAQRRDLLIRWLGSTLDQLGVPHAPGPEPLAFDSLTAVELRHRLDSDLDAAVPLARLLAGLSFDELVVQVEASVVAPPGADTKREPLRRLPHPTIGEHPAAYGQRALWVVDQLRPSSAVLNLSVAARVTSALDLRALSESFAEVVRRHQALRTIFRARGGDLFQVVPPELTVALTVVELDENSALDEPSLREAVSSLTWRPFDLQRGPLLRLAVVSHRRRPLALVLVTHHLISDFRSQELLFDELLRRYAHRVTGSEPVASDVEALRPSDGARWERRALEGKAGDALVEGWRRLLDPSNLPVLQLPLDHPRPPAPSHRAGSLTGELPAEAVAALLHHGRAAGCTPFMTFLALYGAFLQRLTGQTRVTPGAPVTQRDEPGTENLVGYWVNPLPFPLDPPPDAPLEALLADARGAVLEVLALRRLPFQQLVERLAPRRDPARSPVFQTLLTLQQPRPDGDPAAAAFALGLPGIRLRTGPLELESLAVEQERLELDLALTVAPVQGRWIARLTYAADLLERTTTARWLEAFGTYLSSAAARPQAAAASWNSLTAAQRHQLLREWTDTAAASRGGDVPVPVAVAAQAARDPQRVAVTFGARALTYGEMEAWSSALARRLRCEGVGAGRPVGVHRLPDLHLPAILLAIFKAGGAYLPLDPSYPADRLRWMTEDGLGGDGLVIASLATRDSAALTSVRVLVPEDEASPVNEPTPVALVEPDLRQLAYVIYTSGSTGRPKGVMVSHGALTNFLRSMARRPGVDAEDRVLSLTSLSFDISTLELFLPLLCGARVQVVERRDASDGLRLRRAVEALAPTVMQATPSTWRMLLDAGWAGDPGLRVLSGGEALPAELARRLASRVSQLWNVYGPTETTVWSSVERLSGDRPVTIGGPLRETGIHVSRRGTESVPPGAVGEILIGGRGVTRGYLGRPALTADRFRPDPFGSTPGARLYRTGDLGRWRVDGRLECLGRADFQVKVRGHRIELGEIEAALEARSEVAASAARALPAADGAAVLVAYFVAADGATPNPESLLSALARRLPSYMVPQRLLLLDELPLTPNGKVDRKALPLPDLGVAIGELGTLDGTVEAAVGEIWCRVLEVPAVGPESDFFQLGGHSLLATQVLVRLAERFAVQPELASFFARPTVAGLAREVEELLAAPAAPQSLPPVERLAPGVPRPLSLTQERLWFLDRLEGSGSYNIHATVALRGTLHRRRLTRAFETVVERHEILRTLFTEIDGIARPRVQPPAGLEVPMVDLVDLPGDPLSGALALATTAANRPFRLGAERPLRLCLLRWRTDHHLLLVTLPHVVADGWSMGLVVREVAALYEGRGGELEPMTVQFGDYAAWQRRWHISPDLEREMAYWRDVLEPAPEPLELPLDHPRPDHPLRAAGVARFQLSTPARAALERGAQAIGGTLFTSLFALLAAELGRLSGTSDVVIGTAVANRQRPEVEHLVGPFVNTLPLRLNLGGDPTYGVLLQRGQATVVGALERQAVPFELLVQSLGSRRDLQRQPLVQVLMVLQNAPLPSLRLAGLELEPVDVNRRTADFELVLTFEERAGGLAGRLEYAADLFETSTVERLARRLSQNLARAEELTLQPLSRWQWLTAAERHQVLEEWGHGPFAASPPVATPGLLHRWVLERARHQPSAAAVVAAEGGVLTYGELARRSEILARRLRARGAGAEAPVGLCLRRGVELPVAILAILRSGSPCVPLDPTYPPERLELMVRQAGLRLVVAGVEELALLPDSVVGVSPEDLEPAADELAQLPQLPAPEEESPDQLLYVLFTSGSTGVPKGIALPHRALAGLLRWQLASEGYAGGDDGSPLATLQFTSVSFDVSFQEIFLTWCDGGAVVVVSEADRRDFARLPEYLQRHGVGRLMLPFVALDELARAVVEDGAPAPASLREVITAGEQLRASGVVRELFRRLPRARLHNQYGPAETHVVTAHPLASDTEAWSDLPPIGRPVAGVAVRLLDRHLRPLPAGAVGELFLAGPSLARGYHRRPALTAERFLPDPHGGPGHRVYRTGDLARFLPDGALRFLGRSDQQIKIRGHRVETGEVEAHLAALPDVTSAVVALVTDAGPERLVGYAVAGTSLEDPEAWADDLRRRLAAELPDPMVPAQIVPLETLPLTPSGKTDRRAMPAPPPLVRPAGRSPETPMEDLVARAWGEVLELPSVGADDDFFELGGHSLLATRALARMRAASGVDLPLRTLFQHSTVAALAAQLEAVGAADSLDADEVAEAPAPRRWRQDEDLPLSPAQERLWFLDQLDPERRAAYVIAGAVEIRGELWPRLLSQALEAVVRRHQVLRTTFADRDGRPVRRLRPAQSFPLPVVRLGDDDTPRMRRELEALYRREAQRPFDLGVGPLIRACLIQLAPGRAVLLLSMHHIVSDGWSLGVLLREVTRWLDEASLASQRVLEPLPLQYADYAAGQRRWLESSAAHRQVEYWRRTLDGAPKVLDLPTDHPRPQAPSGRGGQVRQGLDDRLWRRLEQRCQSWGATPFMVLLTAWTADLARRTGRSQLVVGTAVAGRDPAVLEPLVGLFVNTLPLRLRLDRDGGGSPCLEDAVAAVGEVCLEALEHQRLPFEKLVEAVQPHRALGHSPLFQVLFVLQNTPDPGAAPAGLELTNLGLERGTAKLDLVLTVEPPSSITAAGAQVELEYSADLFDATTARRMVDDWLRLLVEGLERPRRPLAHLPWLSAVERQAVLLESAGPALVPGADSVFAAVADHARRHPGRVAVVQGERRWTYGELDDGVARLTAVLRDLGVGFGSRIGVCLTPSPEALALLLAVHRAGGAYVPLDPSYPRSRLAYMSDDAFGAAGGWIVTEAQLMDRLPASSAVPRVELGELLRSARSARPLAPPPTHPRQLAYVIYTSGSTGRPKGVMVPHGGLLSLLASLAVEPGLGPEDQLLAVTPTSFDISAFELFGPLWAGGRVHLVRREEATDGDALRRLLDDGEITFLVATPATWRLLLAADWRGSEGLLAVSSGEALPAELAPEIGRRCRQLWNFYGPTETTIFSTVGPVRWQPSAAPGHPLPRITIGRAVANTDAQVLDSRYSPTPVGVPGELYLGGSGVTGGYLGRPALTAERFLPAAHGDATGARMYRTGDLARYLPGGEIQCLGRLDGQVKVRGFRIELGEIEARLAGLPQVASAAVVVRDFGDGDQRLIAYWTSPSPLPGAAAGGLREALLSELPEYMVPNRFVALEALPLTPSGKVDRKALATLETGAAELGDAAVASRPPETQLERRIAEVWCDVLGLPEVGAEVGFFELGGHSLLATRLMARLRAATGVDMPLRTLFESPTVAALARAMAGGTAGGGPDGAALARLATAESSADRPLSPAQERMWFLHQLEPGAAYNLVLALRLRGDLDSMALRRTLAQLVGRHSALRTVYRVDEGETLPRPVVLVPDEAGQLQALPLLDLSALAPEVAERVAQGVAQGEMGRSFDLRRGPLFRQRLVKLALADHLLVVSMHHIATDNWSLRLLARELVVGYEALVEGKAPPWLPMAVSYADYALWLRRQLETPWAATQLEVQRLQLAQIPAALPLPTDRPRHDSPGPAAALFPLRWPAALARRVETYARDHRTTAFSVLCATWAFTLSRWAGVEDLCLGVPEAGRPVEELQPLVGLFVNTLVLRFELGDAVTLDKLVATTSERLLTLRDHSFIPFEKLVEELQPPRSVELSPIFQVMMDLRHGSGLPSTCGDLTLERVPLWPEAVKFDLLVSAEISDAGIEAEVEYRGDLFEEITVARLMSHWRHLLEGALEAPQRRLGDLPLDDLSLDEVSLDEVPLDGAALRSAPSVVDTAGRLTAVGVVGIDRDTGDVARRRADGTVESLGPPARRVPIHGVPVSLDQMEADLVGISGVSALVAVVPDPSGTDDEGPVPWAAPPCVLWVESSRDDVEDALLGHLMSRPPYFRPRIPVMVEAELPRTVDGSVDRETLARRPVGKARRDPAVLSGLERRLAQLWSELLQLPVERLTGSFFELGGHSLLAARLRTRIRETFGVDVGLRDLFENASLAAQARWLSGASGIAADDAPDIDPTGEGQLSFAQERLWFLDRLDPGQAAYNIPLGLRLKGALDIPALDLALCQVVLRHEVLRTVVESSEDGLRGRRLVTPEHLLRVVDSGTVAEARRLARREVRRPFDLAADLLLRGLLLRRGPQDHDLVLTLHHIAGDGWSLGILLREVATAYEALRRGAHTPPPSLPLQYADLAARQRRDLAEDRQRVLLKQWCLDLEGMPVALDLPTDRPRPAVQDLRGTTVRRVWSAELVSLLDRGLSGGDFEPTAFVQLAAALGTVLGRLAGQRDFALGTPVANRDRRAAEQLVGFFVNTVPLRLRLEADPEAPEDPRETTFRTLVRRLHTTSLQAFDHQQLPFERLVEELVPDRDRSRPPLVQVLLAYQNTPAIEPRLADLDAAPLPLHTGTAKFDLTFSVEPRPRDHALVVEVELAAALFDRSTVERWLDAWEGALVSGLHHPEALLFDLPLLTAAQRSQVLVQWSDVGGRSAPANRCLHEDFFRRAAADPEATALRWGDEIWSYRRLARRAEAVTAHLLELGVGVEDRVAVFLRRTPQLVAALLGTLRSGAAYVPLDPEYPAQRVAFMLADSGARVVLTDRVLRTDLPAADAAVVSLEELATDAPGASVPSSGPLPGNLAYLIYTSGSTGRPKAVAIEHRSAVELIDWARVTYRDGELSHVLASTSVCFDLSVFELFVPLSIGCTVVLVDNLLELPVAPARNRVTLVNTVPSAAAALLESGPLPPAVEVVNLAGEALPGTLAERLLADPAAPRVINLYGPSEDTTYSTVSPEVGGSREPVIGRPLAATRVYVTDGRRRPLPAGAAGELSLASASLARGYLGRPGLTAERFLPNPFGPPGSRLYRTGDLARWLPDGRLDYLGRIDHQVKLRGFRIELGEIEAVLNEHPEVARAVVSARSVADEVRLVAYVEPSPEATGESAGEALPRVLRDAVEAKLPAYMGPSHWVVLDRLPLNPNGKVDRRRLPSPSVAAAPSAERVAPRTPLERQLAQIWSDLLRVKEPSVTDSFFALGGHSLLAARLLARVRRELSLDELPLASLFDDPTLEGLAVAVMQQQARQMEDSEMSEMLAEIGDLSEEEIQAMLELEMSEEE